MIRWIWIFILVSTGVAEQPTQPFHNFPSYTPSTENFQGLNGIQISFEGKITIPAVQAHQFASVYQYGRTQILSSLLLSPRSVLYGKDTDSVFHELKINPSTGILQRKQKGEWVDVSYNQTLEDLKTYLFANQLENSPTAQKFLQRNWPNFPAQTAIAQGGDHSRGRGQTRIITSPVESSTPPPISNQQTLQSQPTPSATALRLPLFFAHRANREGNRITVQGNQCGSTAVAKKPTSDSNVCEMWVLTAAHCIPTESDYLPQGNPRTPMFLHLVVGDQNQSHLKIKPKQMRVFLGPNYTPTRTEDEKKRGPLDDYALLQFNTSCSFIPDSQITTLAPITPNGMPSVTQNYARIYTQHIRPDGSPDYAEGYYSPNARSANYSWVFAYANGKTNQGDSGGPVVNSHNQLIGVLTGGSRMPDGREVGFSFNPKAIAWAKSTIDRRPNPTNIAHNGSPIESTASVPLAKRNLASTTMTSDRRLTAHIPKNSSSQDIIQFYENEISYGQADQYGIIRIPYIGGARREYFTNKDHNILFADIRRDVDQRGPQKITLAYFGPYRRDLEERVRNHPWVQVRRYDYGTPEHTHASWFQAQALTLDGLGRKITRHTQPAEVALEELINGDEPLFLRDYVAAKKGRKAPTPTPLPKPPAVAFKTNPAVLPQGLVHQALKKCVACHTEQQDLLGNLKNIEGLNHQLTLVNSATLNRMIPMANLSHEEEQALRNYVQTIKAVNPTPKSSPIGSCYIEGEAKQRLIAEQPKIVSGSSKLAQRVTQDFSQGRVLFYTKKEVPVAFQTPQDYNTMTLGGGDNFTSANRLKRLGYQDHGNSEFPWQHSAGTDLSRQFMENDFFILPSASGAIAQAAPKDRYRNPDYFGRSTNLTAIFQGFSKIAGTVFGERLKIKDPETGEAIPFEIRLRIKNADGSESMDVLRPFENPLDLATRLLEICSSQKLASCNDLKVGAFIAEMKSPKTQVMRASDFVNSQNLQTHHNPLKLNKTAGEVLQPTASIQTIPDLPFELVRKLLKETPFKSVFGKPWVEGNGNNPAGWAPTTRSQFSIVPPGYFAGFIPMTQKSCTNCHDSAGRHVDQFDPLVRFPNDDNRNRTWYDHIRGDDNTLSWHPFEESNINNSRSPYSKPLTLKECLVRQGLFRTQSR